MSKAPSRQHITDLAYLLKAREIRHIVICPGSRNAPLMQVFERDSDFVCHSIVDERSAAYVAMGMILELKAPVAIVTTSGTATLNLAPAVAEANMQNLPLLVLTADRPAELPSQFSNQRIEQRDIYAGNSRGFLQIEEPESAEGLEKLNETVNHFLRVLHSDLPGPLHFNFLFREPLYEEIPRQSSEFVHKLKPSDAVRKQGIPEDELKLIAGCIRERKNILLMAGMDDYSAELKEFLEKLILHSKTAVISENLANLGNPDFISAPELVFQAMTSAEKSELRPDLLICIGGQIVSKRAMLYVRALEDIPVFSYEKLASEVLSGLTEELSTEQQSFQVKNKQGGQSANSYLQAWKAIENRTMPLAVNYLESCDFSNVYAMHEILKMTSDDTHVHLGSSGSVRYSQLFAARQTLHYQSNRGTSGIDGCLSTAVGAAMVSNTQHLAILGDLSFIYDSNALWNRKFPNNLSIIVLNDRGGGIFRIIKGPDKMSFFKDFSLAHHPVLIEQLVAAFGLNYIYSSNKEELDCALKKHRNNPSESYVIEVDTSTRDNSKLFKEFYKTIKRQ